MIEEVHGNILDADVEALINTVNTVGVMGKGIALQFKQAFPDNYRAYKIACDQGRVQVGKMFVFDLGKLDNPRYVINFPTKRHWRSKSRLEDIDQGLGDLVKIIHKYEITSIAIPALGCGNGGLSWESVRPMIVDALSGLKGVAVYLYPPAGAPPAKSMPVGTKAAGLTRGRAALIELMRRYMKTVESESFVAPNGVSLLEIQKLTYFLQVVGEDLRLEFCRANYGPYAENLNHVLQRIEGHYMRGYGDRSEEVLKLSPIELLPGAIEEANAWIAEYATDLEFHFGKIEELIAGFASPYGLELLSTVHWAVANHPDEAPLASDEVVSCVQGWSRRKQELFTPKHIRGAYRRLVEHGWLKEPSSAV